MTEVQTFLFALSIPCYAASLLCQLFDAKSGSGRRAAFVTLLSAVAAQTASVVIRGAELGRFPLASVYEFIVLFSLFLAVYMTVSLRRKERSYILIAAYLVIIVLNVAAALMKPSLSPLVPALQSPWLQFHVLSAILAYGSFGAAFCMAVVYLISGRKQGRGAAELNGLDRRIYKTILFGYLFMSAVLLTGAVWAEQVWGAWWSWDPKETSALVTWLIYTLYLHLRVTGEYAGKKSVIVAAAGFAVVLFTLFGATWLLRGLHSYT